MLQRSTNSAFFHRSIPLAVRVFGGLLGCVFVVFLGGIAYAQSTTVLTYHNDTQRTGWNQSETILTPANVTASTFGQIVTVALDGQVDAQPLVATNVTIGGTNRPIVVYVVTENNSVYAIDGSSGNILLQANFGSPIIVRKNCGNQTTTNGILGTPVIDLTHNELFMIALVQNGPKQTFQLHALNLQTLQDISGSPVTITASQTLENGSTYNFTPSVMKQRPGLLEANGNIYAAFGSCADAESKNGRGWMMGWNATNLTPIDSGLLMNTLVLTKSPLFYLSSIWMSGYGVAADLQGNLFVVTGNSNPKYNTYTGTTNIQESAVKLSPTLNSVLDLFTPSNAFTLDQHDKDFGAGGVMVLPTQPGPVPDLAVAAGKDGRLFILNRDDMGGFHNPDIPANVNIGPCWCGESYYQGSDSIGRVVTSGGVGNQAQVATWTVNTNLTPALTKEAVSPLLEATVQKPGFFTSISSNGTTANTAIIWAVGRPAGTDNHVTLWAFNGTAHSGSLPVLWSGPAGFWNSTPRDANLVPTVANGKVYVASDHQLAIFGLLPG
jgi:hypothetical protein